MTQFRYRAVSDAGETLQGQMEAAGVEEVIARLQDQGHTPLEAQPADGAGGGSGLAGLFKRGPFTGDQLAQFTHQLATLLGAGQPLDRALGILLDLPEGERAKKLVERVRDRVRGGTTLSQALDEEHGVFPKLYVSRWCAPARRAVRWRKPCAGSPITWSAAQQLRGSIINALIYPAFLMVGVLGSLVLLLAYVVPQFVPIFEDMQVPIPLITQAVLALGNIAAGVVVADPAAARSAASSSGARACAIPQARLAWHTRLLAHARGRPAAAEGGNRAHRAHAGHPAEERRAAAVSR